MDDPQKNTYLQLLAAEDTIANLNKQIDAQLQIIEKQSDRIKSLTEEADRLNNENFWLSKNITPTAHTRVIEMPPLDIGDIAWTMKKYGEARRIAPGRVVRMEIHDGKVYIYTRGAGKGFFGEQVFATQVDAEVALRQLLAEGEADVHD